MFIESQNKLVEVGALSLFVEALLCMLIMYWFWSLS